MSNELAELNQQANAMADLLEAVARQLRANENWPLELDELGNLMVPCYGKPMPGPGDAVALVMHRNKLLRQRIMSKAVDIEEMIIEASRPSSLRKASLTSH